MIRCGNACRAALVICVFACVAFKGSLLLATPMEYHYIFQLAGILPSDGPEFAGGTFEIVYRWDHANLSPIYNGNATLGGEYWQTSWPTSNTTAMLTISGSAAADGVYSANSYLENWQLFNGNSHDSLGFPRAQFDFNGGTLLFDGPSVMFPTNFYSGAPGPMVPLPFVSEDAVNFSRVSLAFPRMTAVSATGYAVLVPEAHSIILLAVGLVWLLTTRKVLS